MSSDCSIQNAKSPWVPTKIYLKKIMLCSLFLSTAPSYFDLSACTFVTKRPGHSGNAAGSWNLSSLAGHALRADGLITELPQVGPRRMYTEHPADRLRINLNPVNRTVRKTQQPLAHYCRSNRVKCLRSDLPLRLKGSRARSISVETPRSEHTP